MPDICENSVYEKCNKEIESKGYDEVMRICVSYDKIKKIHFNGHLKCLFLHS